MNALIENTLQIISRISSCRRGYILQANDHGYSILRIWGGKKEDFDLLNDMLFNLYKTEGIDSEKIQSLVGIRKLLTKVNVSGLFIKELIHFVEKNQTVYILLFSDDKSGIDENCKTIVTSVLSILNHQVKEWFDNNTEISGTQKFIVHGKTVSEDWKNNFNLLLETSPDIVFVTDNSGKIILVNKSGSDLLEYAPAELKGMHITDLVEHQDSTIVNFSLNQVLTREKPVKFRAHLHTKYGQVFPFEINCNKVSANGKVSGMISICKDLSEYFKYSSELQKIKPRLVETYRLLAIERARTRPQKTLMDELNRLKNDFISNISHEFRTTLASIIGFSETIESDPNLPEEMKKEFNRMIMSEGKRLAKLINDILDASKVEDGKIVINKTILDILQLIQEVIEINSPTASSKRIALTYEHPKDKIFIEADRESIFHAIGALVNNSIKFTGENGRVKIVVNNLFREVEIIISDTGIGITEGDLPYIFQKFYRISRPRGDLNISEVGLVFVKQIIDLHKGLITVQSEPGSGTTFLVKLPKSSKIEKNGVTFE